METLDHGVCRLSLVPVRTTPSDKAELCTQLLFGDHYTVVERTPDSQWVRIQTDFDEYHGWIDARQHHAISKDYFDYLGRAELKITTDLSTSILYNKLPLAILMGSVIPISSAELFKMEEQFAFNGEAKNTGQKREFDFLRSVANRYLHAPYLWGGKSPFGIDCSGFTQMVFKICGYKLLRDARQQATQGKAVRNLTEVKPGDLAFFKNQEEAIVHVGIVYANAQIIHASGRVRVDTLNETGIVHAETGVVTHQLSHLRRILPA
jgi:gamma-D-glutamyl-L-lysine dipeptidyl-peptidase